ncbi:MAG: hypothetical protein HQL41_05315 [Alphaproteobacteria bacterium]|nr:hypothetical protein [Alphaproteobacteria bacterium]
MNILVIPEDFRKDQYLLRPLFDRLLISIGKKNARVRVCQDPLLGGIREALNMERLQEIVERYESMTQIFILCVDRDCLIQRRQQLDRIERRFGSDRIFLAENAWEELETWTLAGLDLPSDWRWSDIRADGSVKEHYFDVLATRRAVADGPGGGRKVLGEESARRVDVIRRKCAEDFGSLATRLKKVIRGAG